MGLDTVINLISKVDVDSDNLGNPIYEPVERKIFAQKKSVRQSEFFQAAAVGFKPEIVLEVNSFEYRNEENCIFENKNFRIYRAYPIKGKERTELYLTAVVGDSNVFA